MNDARGCVLVAITGSPGAAAVIRRASELAQRAGLPLVGVHVASSPDLVGGVDLPLDAQRALLGELGGAYREVVADDVGAALLRTAETERATQIVVGATRRTRWERLLHGGIVDRLLRDAGMADVYVVRYPPDGSAPARARRPVGNPRLPVRRRLAGWALAVSGIPLLTIGLVSLQRSLNVTSSVLLYLLLVTVVAVVGGRVASLAAAVVSAVVVNWYFTPPVHTLSVASPEHALALGIFLAVAALVSGVVVQVTEREADVARARASAEALARVAGDVLGEDDPLHDTVRLLHSTFALDGVTVLERRDGGPDGGWELVEATGSAIARGPEDGESFTLDPHAVVVLRGGRFSADDRHLLRVFIAQLAAALERRHLRAAAAEASALAQTDQLRTAILRAVSHDLRTPLASIKASITTLLQDDVDWTSGQRREFLGIVDEEADRLNRLVGNLLDMSRIEAGAVQVARGPVALEEVVAAALTSLSGLSVAVDVDVSEELPPADADGALLERAVANLVANAARHSPPGTPIHIDAGAVDGRLRLLVVDHGRGIADRERDRVLEPFQRSGDHGGDTGVGLGLAVARGFVDAMGGALSLEETDGGGVTAIVDLPALRPDTVGSP